MYELKQPVQAIQVTDALLKGVGWPEWCRDALLIGSIDLREGTCDGSYMDLTEWVVVVGTKAILWSDASFRSMYKASPAPVEPPITDDTHHARTPDRFLRDMEPKASPPITVGSLWDHESGWLRSMMVVNISEDTVDYVPCYQEAPYSTTKEDFFATFKPRPAEVR